MTWTSSSGKLFPLSCTMQVNELKSLSPVLDVVVGDGEE
jgi:hypothetical protein